MPKLAPAGIRQFTSRRVLAGSVVVGLLGASAMLPPALAADSAKTMPYTPAIVPDFSKDPGVPLAAGAPPLMLPSSQGWTAYIRKGGPPDATDYGHARTFNEWAAPLSGIGPISDGPAHPFYNNSVATQVARNSNYRVADLSSEAAKNLMPWAIDALKKQNALALADRNGETRQARCWETGVPDIHEAPQSLYFIQTAKEVVMYQGGRVRHVFMNVPHSKNPEPSWYGESVGRYEGDTLVVDTIALNDKTFVDGFRTPHTAKLHVVERFRVVDGGKALDISWTADDPGLAYKPWGARRPRYRSNGRMDEDTCAANNDDRFHLGFDPVPQADRPDF
jgi:hypothetical protein